MFQRINFYKIIRDHLHTLRRIDTDRNEMAFWDFILFIFGPLIVAIVLAYFQVSIASHITDLITAVSIIGGFLFNLLAIIYGLMDKLTTDSQASTPESEIGKLKRLFVKELHINISFNILISLFLLVSLLLYSYLPDEQCNLWIIAIHWTLTVLTYFLTILFFLTMLMILNRIYILLKKDESTNP